MKYPITFVFFLFLVNVSNSQRIDFYPKFGMFDPIDFVISNIVNSKPFKIEREIIKSANVKKILVSPRQEYYFDTDGNIIEYLWNISEYQTIIDNCIYNYDNLNRIKSVEHTLTMSKFDQTKSWFDYIFYYDEFNRAYIIEEIFHAKDGKFFHPRTINLLYQEKLNNNQLTELNYLYSDYSGTEVHLDYNVQGDVIFYSEISVLDGILKPSIDFDKYVTLMNENGLIYTKIVNYLDTTEYSYNIDNRIIELYENTKDNDPTISKYFYNDRNKLIDSVIVINNKDTTSYSYTYEYYK